MLDIRRQRDHMSTSRLPAAACTIRWCSKIMSRAPRERFVSGGTTEFAYEESALPIEAGQTISQPFIVALAGQGLAACHIDGRKIGIHSTALLCVSGCSLETSLATITDRQINARTRTTRLRRKRRFHRVLALEARPLRPSSELGTLPLTATARLHRNFVSMGAFLSMICAPRCRTYRYGCQNAQRVARYPS
jgi:hypothetical protein